MKPVELEPNDIEHCSKLNWDELMEYLEKKYGKEFQEQFSLQLIMKMEGMNIEKQSHEKEKEKTK